MSHQSQNEFSLEQSVFNKTAEAAISASLESVQNLEVNLDTKVSQLVKGEANSLKITAKKVVVVRDIHLERVDLICDNLSVDLARAILGKVSFQRPGNFQVKLVFTESDCDRLLNSKYVKILLQSLLLDLPQKSTFYLQEAKCYLQEDGKVSLTAVVVLNREQQVSKAKFKIEFQFQQAGSTILFSGGRYLGQQVLHLDETVAIMDKIRELLYLRHYSNPDLSFEVTAIEIETKQLILRGNAQIIKLPESISQSIEMVASDLDRH